MDVCISTNEKSIPVKYGMINLREEREGARQSLKYILTDICEIKKSYIRLGYHLYEFQKYKFYEDFGYSTLEEFAEVNLNLDKSAINRCIAVCKNFCRYNQESSSPTMFIDPKYNEYSYSQLVEMLPLNDDQRRMIKPEMTIKQIREIKKCKVSQKKENVSQVATSQQDFLNKVKSYSGIVLQNYIRGISEDECLDCKHITLYDSKGKEIFKLNTCDILYQDDNEIYFRQVGDLE